MIPKNRIQTLQAELDGDVQVAYANLLDREDYNAAAKIRRATGVKPRIDERMKEKVQEEYNTLFGMGYADPIEFLREFTGIAPVADSRMKESVQKGYEDCFRNARGCRNSPNFRDEADWHIESAKIMKNIIGIGPSKELLKQYPEFAEVFK
jgi:hypothetical protein